MPFAAFFVAICLVLCIFDAARKAALCILLGAAVGMVSVLHTANRLERIRVQYAGRPLVLTGKIPSKKLYEDEQVVAFYDINPQAKVHFLVVPKKHITSAAALTEEDGALLGHIFAVIAKLAAEQGLNNGYRVISNVGEDAGQTVKHLHFHVLGGEKLPV